MKNSARSRLIRLLRKQVADARQLLIAESGQQVANNSEPLIAAIKDMDSLIARRRFKSSEAIVTTLTSAACVSADPETRSRMEERTAECVRLIQRQGW